MIGVGGFIGFYFCEKFMEMMKYSVLVIDVCGVKIQYLFVLGQLWSDCIEFYKINIKSDICFEGFIKVFDLVCVVFDLM